MEIYIHNGEEIELICAVICFLHANCFVMHVYCNDFRGFILYICKVRSLMFFYTYFFHCAYIRLHRLHMYLRIMYAIHVRAVLVLIKSQTIILLLRCPGFDQFSMFTWSDGVNHLTGYKTTPGD